MKKSKTKSVKKDDEWVSPAAKSKTKLLESIVSDKVKISQDPMPISLPKSKDREERSACMSEIEARVEAASASRMWGRVTYIVQKGEEFYLVMDKAPEKFFTYYRDGAERGEGVFKTDGVVKKRVQTINGETVRKEKSSKTPAVLEHKELTVQDLQTLSQTCLATIGKKEWVVQVRSGWCLIKQLVDQCKDGLVMVLKGQGYYLFPKSMWAEFDSIFKSRSYLEGSGYSQSVLPKKFDKYFTKFK